MGLGVKMVTKVPEERVGTLEKRYKEECGMGALNELEGCLRGWGLSRGAVKTQGTPWEPEGDAWVLRHSG